MFFGIEIEEVLRILAQLGIAYFLALPVGWNSESNNRRNAGLRTFPLVAIASCGYMIVGMQVLGSGEAESRVLVGVITGMGFIGGGAIIKDKSGVSGTATAASLWVTGALGLAVAYNRYEVAIALSLVTYLTLRLVPHLKEKSFD